MTMSRNRMCHRNAESAANARFARAAWLTNFQPLSVGFRFHPTNTPLVRTLPNGSIACPSLGWPDGPKSFPR